MEKQIIIKPEIQKLADMAKATHNERIIDKAYSEIVDDFIRQNYYERDVEAILNNYLAEPSVEKYNEAFKELQAYRKACKEKAKELLGIE